MYSHTQRSKALAVLAVALVGATLVLTAYFGPSELFQTAPVLLIVFLLLLNFSTLTICVEQGRLVWSFGIGFPVLSASIADIACVEGITVPWWYGRGIHLTPRGWIYNVAGNRAIEITLKNGKHFMLGTDEPEILERVLKDSLPRG
jgi:hypothetical protein